MCGDDDMTIYRVYIYIILVLKRVLRIERKEFFYE